jgi:hypothetical protein
MPPLLPRHPERSRETSKFRERQRGNRSKRQVRGSSIPLRFAQNDRSGYSRSIVLGGLLEMSQQTRFTPLTSLMTRLEIRARIVVALCANPPFRFHPVGSPVQWFG